MFLKICRACKFEKLWQDFYFSGNTSDNLMAKCKECHKKQMQQLHKEKSYKVDPKLKALRYILEGAKRRAIKNNLKFNIKIEDIEIPEYCPIFKTKLEVGHPHNALSLDRTDNLKGYTKDNVRIISRRANYIKNSGTALEHKLISEYIYKVLDNNI